MLDGEWTYNFFLVHLFHSAVWLAHRFHGAFQLNHLFLQLKIILQETDKQRSIDERQRGKMKMISLTAFCPTHTLFLVEASRSYCLTKTFLASRLHPVPFFFCHQWRKLLHQWQTHRMMNTHQFVAINWLTAFDALKPCFILFIIRSADDFADSLGIWLLGVHSLKGVEESKKHQAH